MKKLSTTDHNLAKWIAAHIARRFPDLADTKIPGVWFTGSQIWSMTCGMSAPSYVITSAFPSAEDRNRDWDIFTLTELSALQLVTGMGWHLLPSFPTRAKRSGERNPTVNPDHLPNLSKKLDADGNAYSDGYCYVTTGGDVDVWVTGSGSALDEIRTYPSASHAHCRAAYSMTDGLIMLPNEAAEHGVQRSKVAAW